MKTDHIYHGDCLEIMKEFPDNSVDLIITSPPYNIKNSTGNGYIKKGNEGNWARSQLEFGYDGYTDDMPYEDYVKWQKRCLKQMMRLIPDTGGIFYNHKWRVQDGLIQDRHEIVGDFPVRQVIIWQKQGGVNFNDNYFLPTYEVIYLICKPKFMLKPRMCKYGDIWKFSQDTDNKHPAPFPLGLPDRIISCIDCKIVLDPFMGSGTTAIAALMNGVKYIGIEQSKKYVNSANKRIKEYIKIYGKKSLLSKS